MTAQGSTEKQPSEEQRHMEDSTSSVTPGVSTEELERRWTLAREVMRDDQIDFLVARNDEEFLGGYIRWFTDVPARHSYPYTVIFPVDEEMTLVSPGPFSPNDPGPPPWSVRGVKKRLGAPYFTSAHFTSSYDAELVAGVLKEKKKPVVGLVGTSTLPFVFIEYLKKNVPGAKFVDVTDKIDQLKAIKSEEEIVLIKRAAEMQDVAFEHLLKTIKPGMKESEVYAEAVHSCNLQGSSRGLVLVASASPGTPAPFKPLHLQNKVIQEGEYLSLLIEMNGPGGFYTELGRTISFGKPTQELQDAFATAVEAQALTLKNLKPGAIPKEIWDKNNEFLTSKGYLPEARLYAHGQGYDLVERPLIRHDDPMNIQAGMSIVVHPTASTKTVWTGVVDNYMVTEDGVSACLHRTPKKIYEL